MAQKYKVITYCDFNEPGRKDVISRHKTIATAMRQYARIWEIYGRLHKCKVWQEEVKEEGET